jgi:hypothetical protein
MENDNRHSSDNIENTANIDRIENIDTDTQLPLVDALTTPFLKTIVGRHAATLRKIQAREKDIQAYKRQIQDLDFAIAIQESYALNIQKGKLISHLPSDPPTDPTTSAADTLRAT